ncbi:MAG TPA: UDP-N-acetylmuramoyl-tripeptide--D-alanyl-D-alanine ligase, partial [Candidatus Limnocylindria bacterium]|nr:UDP-N-acetylmuramoyl-tripeptide--D-alanyl-D-alanine ligase [Candidatus Limnocylindria bacterium]
MQFDAHFVRGALAEVEIIHDTFPREIGFSVDTRTLRAGDIFVALVGNNVDGHDFIAQAVAQGAAGLMIATAKKDVLTTLSAQDRKKLVVILVPDTLQALLRLASVWRAQFTYPVVAVTGSVGKTSTKEMLARMLSLHGQSVLVSQGNQNTRIGIALNILRMRSEHNVAVFEVGINKRGEMVELANLLRPTTGIITGVGHCHMEGLGSLADIATEKRDLFKYFTEQSIGIINGDQPLLASVGYVHPVIKFGSKTINQIQARKIQVSAQQTSFFLKIYKEKYQITIANVHEGYVFNALAAAAAAHLLGVSNATIIQAMQQPLVVPGRFEQRILKDKRGHLINDCYNANPESMKAALLAFQKIETPAQKIAVLGDMLELGIGTPFWHRQLGRFLRKVPSLKHLILVGEHVRWTKKTAPVHVTVTMV